MREGSHAQHPSDGWRPVGHAPAPPAVSERLARIVESSCCVVVEESLAEGTIADHRRSRARTNRPRNLVDALIRRQGRRTARASLP
jgi:hypothetical protein